MSTNKLYTFNFYLRCQPTNYTPLIFILDVNQQIFTLDVNQQIIQS